MFQSHSLQCRSSSAISLGFGARFYFTNAVQMGRIESQPLCLFLLDLLLGHTFVIWNTFDFDL